MVIYKLHWLCLDPLLFNQCPSKIRCFSLEPFNLFTQIFCTCSSVLHRVAWAGLQTRAESTKLAWSLKEMITLKDIYLKLAWSIQPPPYQSLLHPYTMLFYLKKQKTNLISLNMNGHGYIWIRCCIINIWIKASQSNINFFILELDPMDLGIYKLFPIYILFRWVRGWNPRPWA